MKDNKTLYYVALAIGGAFLIHYMMMKYKKVDKVSNPANPGSSPLPVNPIQALTQPIIKAMALQDIAKSSMTESALDNIHPMNEYDTANTYQNFFGRSLNGMYKGCPTII
jgi:hypothetical protein